MIWKLRVSQINGVGFRLYITRFRVDSEEEEGPVMEGEVQVRRWDKSFLVGSEDRKAQRTKKIEKCKRW